MFTGIVQEIGRVKESDSSYISVEVEDSLRGLRIGDSIAVNGACLTVSSIGSGYFSVNTMPETLRRTNMRLLNPGAMVNLESALTLSSRLGGHLLQGHVDSTGTVVSIFQEVDAVLMEFQAPPEIMKYVVEKGFIAVDGVSLTVVGCDASTFTVSVVQYTLSNTNIGQWEEGELVNLEIDILAKYVEKFLSARDIN